MRYTSVIIGISVLFFMAMIPGKGHLKFDESFKDLGIVKQGEINTYSFSYTNSGDKKVRMASVVAASTCLHIQPIKDSIIEPEATAEIIVDFDTNKHAKGEFAFGITVNSNADNREVKLKMFGVLE
jgi:hypothetical protein